jgi:CBS domain containing-hemolysin-like protein
VRSGAFNKVETQIVSRALELDQLVVRDIMTLASKSSGYIVMKHTTRSGGRS